MSLASGNAAAPSISFRSRPGLSSPTTSAPLRDYLPAIAIFANRAKGYSALQLSRDLNCQYRKAFVLAHKLREAIECEQRRIRLSGMVEIDSAYFGGHIKPRNFANARVDRRLPTEQTGKRRAVVIMRERNGRSLPFVFKKEADGVGAVRAVVATGSTIHADESSTWDKAACSL